jgi:hypothetical protein
MAVEAYPLQWPEGVDRTHPSKRELARFSKKTGERIIAEAIGIDPAKIWPSRYEHKDSTQARKGHRETAEKVAA